MQSITPALALALVHTFMCVLLLWFNKYVTCKPLEFCDVVETNFYNNVQFTKTLYSVHVPVTLHVFFCRRLWLSTVKVNVDVEGPRLSVDLSMVSAELWEYLYRNQAMINHITKPVSVSPVCKLMSIIPKFFPLLGCNSIVYKRPFSQYLIVQVAC